MGIVQQQRESKNISRQKLADNLGVTRQTIHNWEKKKRTPPIKKMEQLSKELGIPLSKITKDYI